MGWRAVPSALLVLWAAATLALTLSPAPYTPPLTLETFLCVGCGVRDTADILANWILFVPGGVLLAAVLGARRGVVLAVGLTVLIETLQIGVPGRDPALHDLLSNTLGALSGALLVRRGLGQRAQHALAAVAALAWLSPLVLLVPMTSSSDVYGLWTPSFATMERYEGEILSATAGGAPVPNGLLEDRAAVDRAIAERRPIELQLRVGPPPSAFAPVFQIVDSRRLTLFSLGLVGSDLILLGHNRSQALRLDQPEVRWGEAMEHAAAGATLSIVIDRSRDSMCISVDDREECGFAPSLAEGWGLIASLRGAPEWLRRLASLGWAAGIGLILGVTAKNRGTAVARVVILGAAGVILAAASPDVRPDFVHAAVLLAASFFADLARPLSAAFGRATN